MNTLLKNILWRSRYFLAGLTVIIVAVVCAVSVHQKSERASERALQVHADLQAKQEKLQREESDRAAQKQLEQERLRVEENDRLAKIQQDKDQKQAEEDIRIAKIQEAERQKRAEEKTAAELKAYKERYLNDQKTRHTFAVLIVNEQGQPNKVLNSALVNLLKTNGLEATSLLLTPQFISDGLFGEVFTGSKAVLGKLELNSLVGSLLLGRQTVEYSTNAALENLVTAHMKLELQTLPLTNVGQEQSHLMESVGAELNRSADSRAQAEDRMLVKIQKQSADSSG